MTRNRISRLGLAARLGALFAVAFVLVLSATAAGQAPAIGVQSASVTEAAVTGHTYVRQDGGSDIAIQRCNLNDVGPTNGSRRQQNEPAVAINPNDPNLIVAGSNDYCTVPTSGDSWMGFYVSSDGGATWMDSLNPGYPGDTSPAGMASPIFGFDTSSGDPIMGWDTQNHLFYGGIAFNRVATNPGGQTLSFGSVLVSTWTTASVTSTTPLGMKYLRTVVVGPGTPAPDFLGIFNDKPSLSVDQGANSPFKDNVYIAWTLFPGNGADKILFSRSTDHGKTFSPPTQLSMGLANAQGSDIAVAPDGTIYVVWRQFAFTAALRDAIVFVKSTNGGASFSSPRIVKAITPYDRSDVYASGGGARDCGSLIYACASGYTFHRTDTLPAAVAGTTMVGGKATSTVVVSWEGLPTTMPTGTTYRPGGQSQVMAVRSTDGGMTWSNPVAVDPQPKGHQWWPNLAYDASTGTFYDIYYDSRADPSYSPIRPPGNDANGKSPCLASGADVPSATCDVVDAYVARSTDGITWASSTSPATKLDRVGHQPEYEMFGNRRVPFHGDYIWVDAVGGKVYGVWTDNRNVVPGTDPREVQPMGPAQTPKPADGFDVKQCRTWDAATGTWGADTCPNAGGLDQDIFGASVSFS